jgi:D-glycero-D-manno-heptose 1,7-bisphosphate phosphatase
VAAGGLSAVLFDRDGVINEPVIDLESGLPESPYNSADVRLVDGIAEVIRTLQHAGIPVAVVSNQPAAAKQTHTLADLHGVDAMIRAHLSAQGVHIPIWNYCYHHPAGSDPILGISCACRKPQPQLLLDALCEMNIAPSEAVMIVGDSDADIGAGRSIGITTVLFEHPDTSHRRHSERPDISVSSVTELSTVLGTYE